MKIYLIGFMGCGKTTLGKKTAAKMSFNFIDLDKEIEARAGMSIPDYFKEFGEAAFRVLERETLQSSEFPLNSIIATGGGAPCFFDNMQWMNTNGTTVYLSLSPKALASRLETAAEERPLLQQLKGDALVEFITQKLSEREMFYKQASLTAQGINITPEKLISILNLPSS